jgi:hypothetical protein
MPPGASGNAQQLIQNLLTTPRAGGFGSQQPASGMGGQTMGGGIAGFASTDDDEGIKIYNDQTNYKKWEFIYDYTKDTGVVGQQGANGTPVSQMGQQPGQQPGQQQSSPFGQSSGGFGQQPSGFGQQPNTPPTGYAPPAPPPPPQQ